LALLGDPDAAEAHFQAARELAERSRSPVWCARVDHDWSRFLASRDARRAFDVGARAVREATALGMAGITQRSLSAAAPLVVRRHPPGRGTGALSAREVDVLRLVAVGCSNREIGTRLFISSNTAANHIRSILQKTGCANRAQAVAYAARQRLLDDLE
jgi:DNA-binding CsgD family transcriptional regulator